MPPLLWPAEPPFVNRSEHRVWNALQEQLGENDLLIANQHFTDHGRDYELDIAVVLDGAGVVVVEVKGGTVWNAHGQWWQKTPEGRAADRSGQPGDDVPSTCSRTGSRRPAPGPAARRSGGRTRSRCPTSRSSRSSTHPTATAGWSSTPTTCPTSPTGSATSC